LSHSRRRRGWDSNPCGTDVPRALKARALTTLPPRHYESTVLVNSVLNVYRITNKLIEGTLGKSSLPTILTVVYMPASVTVNIPSNILDAIYAGAKELYPRESFLMLRGNKKRGIIRITDLIVAPFAVHGEGFAHFNPYMFTGDYSLIGTVHSHPSGNTSPSDTDLNYFFGRVLMIVGYPYEGKNCIAAYNSEGDHIQIEITAPTKCDDEEFYET